LDVTNVTFGVLLSRRIFNLKQHTGDKMKYETPHKLVDAIKWDGKSKEDALKLVEGSSFNIKFLSVNGTDIFMITRDPADHSVYPYCEVGDYLIRDQRGNVWFCEPESFEETFYQVKD